MSLGLDSEFMFMNKDTAVAYFKVTGIGDFQEINIISILAELPE